MGVEVVQAPFPALERNMYDNPITHFLDGLRASASSGGALLLQPEEVRLLITDDVYAALSRLEVRELRHQFEHGQEPSSLPWLSSAQRPEAPGQQGTSHRESPGIEDLFSEWLKYHVADLAAPARYQYSVSHWMQFFAEESCSGRLGKTPVIEDLTPELQRRFRDWRSAAGAGGHTISRDLAALRGALSFARKHHRIDRAPFIADVPMHLRGRPRDRVLSFDEIAAIVDVCAGKPDRDHLVRFIVIELGTAGRPQAVLELTDANIDLERNLIDPNQPGRTHARKRRAIVPIPVAVRPWLTGITGKLITYRVAVRAGRDGEHVGSYFERPTNSIKRSWGAACREAGVVGATPKTLRHTMLTWLAMRGVPSEQRRVFAGHSAQGTTARNYEHLSPGHLKDAVREVDAFFAELRKHTPTVDHPPS